MGADVPPLGHGRLNRVIELLAGGRPAFGPFPVATGNLDEAEFYADSAVDFVIFEMEHAGFDLTALRLSLLALLNRERIARSGLQPNVVPFVRIPANARERNQWIVKQVLDLGVYGVVFPHVETVEDARAVVAAVRYPRRVGETGELAGQRGLGPQRAARYWGVSVAEYVARADVWPLDPNGELLAIALVESARGLRNLPAMLDATSGAIGVIYLGRSDLALDLGVGIDDADLEKAMAEALVVCAEAGVACMTTARDEHEMQLRLDQGFQMVLTGRPTRLPVLEHGLAHSRRTPALPPVPWGSSF